MTAPARPRRKKRKSRRGKILIITLIVLGVLLVGADFALAAAGEYQIAQKMREKLQLKEDPSVRINGFPFILQAVRGDYRHIRIQATGVPVKDEKNDIDIRDLDIEANLLHTRIPLSDLLAGRTGNAVIDQVDGSVKVKALDLNRFINGRTPFDKLSIEPDTRPAVTTTAGEKPSSTAPVKLSGTAALAGKQVVVTAFGVVAVVDGQLQVSVEDVQLDDMSLAQLIPALRDAMNIKVAPGALPFGVTPTAVQVESGAFTLHGTVENVPLDQG
ncbi:hypothetical protein Lesp02_36330 [Lentzea sp. NBRC 105346]|uniref:LmeA family phospholipid-binding protein n=1 Tax=Lentzea sp. NBRC 105346 TaxID=3032205 RepID=UPI0024A1F8A6|nr:DUF2993 domain-containing protein [Lentzea sp. NBRC 105346]GLZ31445.1 hypothetical protein Lesp02_36330 [Lentzea sp. NBRC 105346]